MAYKDPRFVEICDEIKELRKKLYRLQKELRYEKNRTIKRKLEQKIGDLKWLIAWSLIDCREFKKGLAICDSLSWRTHGEEKYLGIGRALLDMERYAEGRRVLGKGFNRFPGSAFLCTMLGTAYHFEKHDHAALLYYEYVLQDDPENNIALYQKALSLNSLGCYEEAAPILQGLTMKYPEDPVYIAQMGHCLLGQGYHEEAIRYYTQAKNMGYLQPDLYAQLHIAYHCMGLKNDALYIAEEGLREFPDNQPVIYMGLGHAYFEMGWLDEARGILTEGLRKFPGDEVIEIMLKRIEDETDNPDKGKNPRIIRLLLLLSILQKRFQRKRF